MVEHEGFSASAYLCLQSCLRPSTSMVKFIGHETSVGKTNPFPFFTILVTDMQGRLSPPNNFQLLINSFRGFLGLLKVRCNADNFNRSTDPYETCH